MLAEYDKSHASLRERGSSFRLELLCCQGRAAEARNAALALLGGLILRRHLELWKQRGDLT